VIERAVRMVFDAKDRTSTCRSGRAIESIAGKIGCTGETLRKWVRQGERDSGARPGPTTVEQQRIKELEREVFERSFI
jgi:transposase